MLLLLFCRGFLFKAIASAYDSLRNFTSWRASLLFCLCHSLIYTFSSRFATRWAKWPKMGSLKSLNRRAGEKIGYLGVLLKKKAHFRSVQNSMKTLIHQYIWGFSIPVRYSDVAQILNITQFKKFKIIWNRKWSGNIHTNQHVFHSGFQVQQAVSIYYGKFIHGVQESWGTCLRPILYIYRKTSARC